jgi:two-component system response regulator HydG
LEAETEKATVDLTPGRSLKEMEREMILRTLEETGGNRTRSAKILGISRRTLQLKLKDYGIN